MTAAHADDNGASVQIDPPTDTDTRGWLFIAGVIVGMVVGKVW